VKVAYFSPLNPQKTGISDYSEDLLKYLSKICDVDIWVDGYLPSSQEISANYKILDYSSNPEKLNQLPLYDSILYNIGNNPYYHSSIYDVFLKFPGIVILHEFTLYFLVAGYYLDFQNNKMKFLEEMKYNAGDSGYLDGLSILEDTIPPLQYKFPEKHPLNRRVIESAKGIWVHSDFMKKMVLNVKADVNCMKINFAGQDVSNAGENAKRQIRNKFGLKETDMILASFGHIAPTKRIHQVLHALSHLREYDFKYILVGEGNYMKQLVNELHLNNHVILTGFTPISEYNLLISCSDIVINLRYPYMGETSAALVRALASGKPCIVSDVGWFSELPDDAVVKIPIGTEELTLLTHGIKTLMDKKNDRKQLAAKAKLYAQTAFNGEVIAEQIVKFVREAQK
jgi:glycosyltransferase involved in cell wall biosynthesis